MRVLVTGSRDWTDEEAVQRALLNVWLENDRPNSLTIVTGGCPTGADRYAEEVARTQGFTSEVHPADWNQHGKMAGPIRNQEMVDTKPDICLAFIKNGSRGATHCYAAAKAAGIPTVVWQQGYPT